MFVNATAVAKDNVVIKATAVAVNNATDTIGRQVSMWTSQLQCYTMTTENCNHLTAQDIVSSSDNDNIGRERWREQKRKLMFNCNREKRDFFKLSCFNIVRLN